MRYKCVVMSFYLTWLHCPSDVLQVVAVKAGRGLRVIPFEAFITCIEYALSVDFTVVDSFDRFVCYAPEDDVGMH
jgi:hypothetical protein